MLRSWALPKGVPTDAQQDRLAVAVPDHDLDHLHYEDDDKSIADIGWWEDEDRTERRLLFTLHGREASVRYALIRTDRDWLLHRTKPPLRVSCAASPLGNRAGLFLTSSATRPSA